MVQLDGNAENHPLKASTSDMHRVTTPLKFRILETDSREIQHGPTKILQHMVSNRRLDAIVPLEMYWTASLRP